MFNSHIVFVLGAGANWELGMPLGRRLADTIAKKMRIAFDRKGHFTGEGDYPLFQELSAFFGETEALRAAARLSSGLQFVKSIDDFLDFNSADKPVVNSGKAAIIKSILEAEFQTKLMDGQPGSTQFTPDRLHDTWFVKFMRLMGQGDPEQFFDKSTFVVFNYDRCLEYFLYYAVAALFGLSSGEAARIVNKASIFHPYGRVASLRELDPSGLPLGSTNIEFKPLMENIRTYTEEIAEQDKLKALHERIESARAIVFLGFAFHEQNMRLLRPASGLSFRKIFATADGISESDAPIIEGRIRQLFNSGPILTELIKVRRDLKCAALFDEYQYTLPTL